MSSSARKRPRRRKPFDPHRFLTEVKLFAFDLGMTVVFLVWLYNEVKHEIGF